MPGFRSVAGLVAVGLLAALLAPAGALATSQTWTVDDPSGAAPNAGADGSCDAPGALLCTLREAVLEANAVNHTDTIYFNLPANTTITLGAGQNLNRPMTIDGCSNNPSTSPCVGIDATATLGTTFGVFDNPTTIKGLAIGHSVSESIFASTGATGLTVKNNWFGLTITGAAAGGAIGIDYRGTNAVIGGTAAGDRNVFANNAGELRFLNGGSNNQVLGNYFGVGPDGMTAMPTINSPSILIDDNGGSPATGNVIGGNTAASENLISNTTTAGLPAIRIVGQAQIGNQVLRNRGTGNSGPFVDLSPPDGLGNNPPLSGANGGIQAPTLQAAAGLLFGSAAPGAVVRIYQGNGNIGDLIGFIGSAQADGSGAWGLPCPSAGCPIEPAGGTLVTAGQTDASGNSSEYSAQVAYVHSIPAPPPSEPAAVPAPAAAGPTGLRAAVLAKCKKKRTAAARRKCRRNALKLPI